MTAEIIPTDLTVCHTHHVMDDRGKTMAVTKTCATPRTCFSQVGCRRDKTTNQTVRLEGKRFSLCFCLTFLAFVTTRWRLTVYTCTLKSPRPILRLSLFYISGVNRRTAARFLLIHFQSLFFTSQAFDYIFPRHHRLPSISYGTPRHNSGGLAVE